MKCCSFAFVLFHRSHLAKTHPRNGSLILSFSSWKGGSLTLKGSILENFRAIVGNGCTCTDSGVFPRIQLVFTAQKISRESLPEHHVILQLILHRQWLGRERELFRGSQGPAPWPHSSLACPLLLGPWDDLRDPEAADIPWGSELGAK